MKSLAFAVLIASLCTPSPAARPNLVLIIADDCTYLDLEIHGGQPMTQPQLAWLELIRGHVETSFHLEPDDLDYAPFDAQGGLGKMHQLFGEQMDGLIDELNRELVA